MSLINSNYRVLIVLLSMVIGGAVTISYLAFNYDTLQLPTLYWLFIQSLSLYIVYLSFQTLFFERFIACFKIKGNVGFFIASIDFIGYTGTVCVLLFKEYCSPNIDWMQFYNQFSGWVGIVAGIAFIGSAIYLMQRYKMEKQNLPTECFLPYFQFGLHLVTIFHYSYKNYTNNEYVLDFLPKNQTLQERLFANHYSLL